MQALFLVLDFIFIKDNVTKECKAMGYLHTE
ncbi:hypothetical protein A1232T_02288 [Psychrobacter piechaudii]|uniref:Uncharacterized protein n=1 Tax=Psychrobacter piechaudii TaxID=1945521 RepID=A0A1R4GZ64_9GAMM|nr:hypothetical protein A1232T_02288 [Psychrobacter piechaudii]